MEECDTGIYEAIVRCYNCGKSISIMVNVGTRLKDHIRLKSEPCTNCKFRIDNDSLEHKGL